jgi:putative transposase
VIVLRTIKLNITGSTKSDINLNIWLNAANWLSNIVFKTKELNSNRLAKAYYAQIREMGLPSQLSCSLCKVICSTYKTGKSNKRWKLAVFTKPVMPIVYNHDFRRTKKGIRLWGELLTIHDSRVLPEKLKDSKIKKIGNNWFLFLCYELEVEDLKTTGCIVGVDMGINRMLVATNSANSKTFFYHGGELNHRRTCIRRTRASVQSVGTRSSRRLLKRMSSHEASVTGHLLHVASKALVSYASSVGARRIVVENLKNIRDSSLSKGKDLRAKICRWPYADMRFKISYKALAKGIETEEVSPKNTSRGCSKCGYVSASNRKGNSFKCLKCNYLTDADRNASVNIRLRSVSIEHNSVETGNCKVPLKTETVTV